MTARLRMPLFALMLLAASVVRAQTPVEAPAPVIAPAPVAPTPAAVKKPGDDIEIPKSEPPQFGDDLSLGWTLLRTMVVLGVVVMLAYLTLNVGLRRALGIKTSAGRGSSIEVLERVPLDQKRTLFVVKAAGEFLLIGGSDGSLSLISKLPTEEAAKQYTPAPVAQLNLSPFLQKLLLKRPDASAKPPPPAPGGPTT